MGKRKNYQNPNTNRNKGNRQVKKGPNKALLVTKKIFSFIGKSLATLFFVGAITGSICAIVLSVAVLQMVDTDDTISLDPDNLSYTTIMYAKDKETGEYVEHQKYHGHENRIYIEIEDVPQHLIDAIVASEDKRFYEHTGVDWIRTTAGGLKWLTNPSGRVQGGSTIDQQLIKNITGDNEVRVTRKVQEIFRAINLEKKYSKQEILAAYLNTIHLGYNTNGVQAASLLYFGKDVKDISLVQATTLAGMIQSPVSRDPVKFPDENKVRRDWVLEKMFEQKMISEAEMKEAIKSEPELKFSNVAQDNINSYFVDYATSQVVNDLITIKGYTRTKAEQIMSSSGLRVYLTVDLDIQKTLEESFVDNYNETFSMITNEEPVEGGMSVITVDGEIKGLIGSTRKKTGNRVLSRATGTFRPPSSSIKPFVYALGIENNLITYSSPFEDKPVMQIDGKDWPRNYYGRYDGWMNVEEALRRSVNPVAVRTANLVGIDSVFYFLKDSVGITSLVEEGNINDRTPASMGIGALTHGVSTLEWSGAYQIFANGGYYTKPYSYSHVTDANGNIILEADTTAIQVIGEDTSFIVNQMMQNVVYGSRGTAPTAKIEGTRVAGKTGTSSDDFDQWFAGMTPDFISVVWMGYDYNKTIRVNGSYPPPIVWQRIMKKVQPFAENKDSKYPTTDKVEEKVYCTISGQLAIEGCPTGKGFFKKSSVLPSCQGHDRYLSQEEIDEARSEKEAKEGNQFGDNDDGMFPGIPDPVTPPAEDNPWWSGGL